MTDIPINPELLAYQLKEITKRLDSIQKTLDNSDIKYVSIKEFEALKKDVESQGSNQSRVVWIIMTAVILAVIGTVIITK